MAWTEGDVWKTEAQVPVGAEVDFKVVKVKGDGGEAVWEDGDNRSFKILGPDFGLNVTCHWNRSRDIKFEVYRLNDQRQQQQQQAGAAAASAVGNGTGARQQQEAAAAGSVATASRSRPASAASSVASYDGDANGNGRAGVSSWVGADVEFVRSRKSGERRGGVWRTEGLSGPMLQLVKGDQEASSWLKKLGLQKRLLVDEPPACRPRLPELSALYVYASWVNTGALPCAESGSHYRPNHHANLALAMFRSLEWVIGDATRGGGSRDPASERLILAARRMHGRLPSFSGEFRVSTPLTRIRDIAHRNDIPKDLKVCVCVCIGLVDLLDSTMSSLDDAHASAVRQLVSSRQRVEAAGPGPGGAKLEDLMALLTATTQARSFYVAGLVAGLRNDVTDEVLSMRQRWRLAELRLEEYAFVVLSRIIASLEEQGAPSKLHRANNLQWSLPLAALTCGLRHLGLSLFNTRELLVLESELQRWHATAPLVENKECALRAKASLERALRVATEYGEAVSEVYGSTAATLGSALGLPEHMGAVFAESEVRSSVAFQVSKLAAMLARALRTAAGQEPWDVLVPGEATGVLREVASLEAAELSSPSASDEGVVLVVRRASGDEELGPLGSRLRGVVLLQELPHLSHLGVRARQDRVGKALAAGRWADVVVPLGAAAAATCGSKAAKCAALAELAAASKGLFAAPRGAVVPFGALEAAVAAAGRAADWEALLRRLDDPRVGGADLEAACAEARALVAGLEVVTTLTSSSAASSAASSSPLLLAVRSSANVEDLAGMAAAGLYESVVGVPADDAGAVAAAVAEVWASTYTRRAVLSRRSAGVSQSSARMAVLVMELVAPDLSFVLHTARPRDGDAGVLLAEVAPGQGETLASGTRGTPWRFEVTKSSGQVATTAFANFSSALVLPSRGKPVAAFAAYGSAAAANAAAAANDGGAAAGSGGRRLGALVEREVDYGTQRMSVDADWRLTVVRQMAAVGSHVEAAMGGVPQDIEGGVVVGPDGSASLHVFQTRPQ
ncbi:hypothetical protein GPECTOR_28g809 [Gonium pectorale]|uniref:CBM20 domain-containing protein n=1 Tax=Gonium pectorale TaxID=33097 RepID=A0A150GEY8_GONPE|nr:hypothetical protein GPECTOR_28g809 [Gonium pectorale]|eukprot:KXZ48402.1 hypothetical protein GPECTOR_28g809 [Gonium pectorale]